MTKYAPTISTFAAVMAVLGVAWPVIFNDGSALAKLLIRNYEVDTVGDADFEAAMVAELYVEQSAIPKTHSLNTTTDTTNYVSTLQSIDRAAALLCLLITLGLTFTCRRWPKLCWLYLIPAIWLLANAQAISINGGKAFAELAVPAHATRFGLLITLPLIFLKAPKYDRAISWVLRISCTLTFAIHGWEAFQLNPAFQDLLYITAGHVNIELSEWYCHGILRVIGVMDLILAIAVVTIINRRLLIWMACWGLITAASRPIAMGFDAWPECAMRLPNSVMPLLLLFHSVQINNNKTTSNSLNDKQNHITP